VVTLYFDDYATEPIIKSNPRFDEEQLQILFQTFSTFKERTSEFLDMNRLLTCMEMFKDKGRRELKIRLLENLDSRYPRGVTFPEFVNFLTVQLADLSNRNNRKIFFDLVADEDGNLTWENLFALCRECNITSSEAEAREIILKMGGQGDGFVTYEEFEKFEGIIERWKNRNSNK